MERIDTPIRPITFIERIQDSVKEATGITLHYASADEINVILDRNPLPCAFLFLLKEGNLIVDNGRYREQANFAVFFVDRTEYDFNTEDNERIIHACKLNAYKWLTYMRRNNKLRITSINSSTRIYDKFDAIVTGYGVNVTISELQGINPDCSEQ